MMVMAFHWTQVEVLKSKDGEADVSFIMNFFFLLVYLYFFSAELFLPCWNCMKCCHVCNMWTAAYSVTNMFWTLLDILLVKYFWTIFFLQYSFQFFLKIVFSCWFSWLFSCVFASVIAVSSIFQISTFLFVQKCEVSLSFFHGTKYVSS
jgi:hypothetical protein